jgi:branched-chain amino acid:cation transporter, LIVCS family
LHCSLLGLYWVVNEIDNFIRGELKNMKKNRDIIVIGFALFAMFFGAGNLIFPPFLGRQVGSGFPAAIIGFLLTGVGLPLLGIIACAKIGGTVENMASRAGKLFSILVTTALVLSIGPLLAIPRTAATTYELGIAPLFPGISPIVGIVIYFLINLAFVIKPSSIIDNIGKILTPVLLVMLSIIIIKGIVSPIGQVTTTDYTNIFSSSLIEGYQTMDAMASVLFSSIVIASIVSKGYKENSEITSMTIKSGVVAVLGLGFIYGGLMYLGSQTVEIVPFNISKTELVTLIATGTLGYFGKIALGISVGLACLTTSIGLTATSAEYFNKLSKGKFSYTLNSVLITLISIIIASMGVDRIVGFAGPILMILYPTIIVLILMTLAGKAIKSRLVFSLTVYTSLLMGIADVVSGMGYGKTFLKPALNLIPLSSIGFSWVIPTLAVFLITMVLSGNKDDSVKESDKAA